MPSEGVPKCQRCRRDHKKCSPENRQWPGTKCDRCENYGYECSENLMARRSSQKEMEPPQPMSHLMENHFHPKFFACSPPMSHSLSIRAPMPILGSPQQLLHCQSPWTGLFEYLRDIDWLNLACSPVSLTGNPFALMFRSSTCPVPDLSATPLGLRLMYLESSAQSQRLIRESTTGIATASLLEHSIHILVHKVQREFPRATMMYSFEELARSCREYVRYGSYWDVFRTALQTDEVLLIDPAYSFDNDFPKTTFESAKQIWLCQELGLKQFCQKLSGVSQMISDLARTEKNSEERAFLAAKIPDRIEEVLGPRISPASVHGYPSPFFPADIVASSPVELTDLAMYSPSDSVGGDGSDDGLSLDGSGFQKMLGTDCFNETRLWSS